MLPFLDSYFKIIKRFLPNSSPGSSVGLDIGTNECKMVEIIKTTDSFELLNWSVELVRNGDVAATIRRLIEKIGVTKKSYQTSVFGRGTLIRYVDMPQMSLDELRNAFSIEADKYFPFTQDQIFTDCYILDPAGKNKQIPVIVAAVKKEIINERVKLLTDLGIPVDFVGIDSIALANVVHVLGIDDKENENLPIALLDMGDTVSNLMILVKRLPRFTRDIFIGSRDFTKKISTAFGISLSEAEKLKRDPGDKINDLLNICDTEISHMVQELKISFDYFSSEKNVEISKLFITGGGAMVKTIDETLAKRLDVKVVHWNPLTHVKLAAGVEREEINKNAHKLGVALGLALYHND